ncbi:isopeptide-forming domain-containing fimbrial protein [cf. Phormidesmis sp. LEGE 11477]|uniref:isopeptide-forming domain-containing fimbrial protein n=1 Tax=cf. Phormidesmis sp. LEGE 11477 TaxID=1828680 RepID=UPI00188266A5|nr:isopeptide-forming domain-containing fimbrial protein [cf. Phormidesmis sp. LEGE 11477]MBE9062967.1 DUF11 domain-containing protein [cf. Phormidesmis sp. LEGE 11477]
MFCHRKSKGKLTRWIKFSGLAILGCLISVCVHSVAIESAIAQPVVNPVPNQASIRYDLPGGDPVNGSDESRVDQLSNIVTYPLGATGGQNTLGLGLFKSANKSVAEPGDVVIYQLLVRNEGTTDADSNFRIVDTLPFGLQFVEGSVSAVLNGADFPLDVELNDRELTLTSDTGLPAGEEINVSYATLLTPDALRGNGINTAVVSADTFDDAEDTFRLTVGSGILSDCGTILGRVFVDKNFDGHQQPGEPGVPNAVIYMDNGNRIITDPDGLFSMDNVLSGNRVGALDLSSLTGYTLAPNLFRIEENSQSRLVRLRPGGLARMNFAVTPTFGEGET